MPLATNEPATSRCRAGTLTLTFTPTTAQRRGSTRSFTSRTAAARLACTIRRLDPRLRPRHVHLRPMRRLPGLPVDQEHHPQGLRRPLQGLVPGGVRCRVPGPVRRQGADLRAPPDRRQARGGAEVERRLRLGARPTSAMGRATRWRKARPARADDLGAKLDARRPDGRGRGGARHGNDAPYREHQ